MASLTKTENVASFMAITGMDSNTASFYLESAGNNMDLAVQLFFSQNGSLPLSSTPTKPAEPSYNVEEITTSPFHCYKIVEADNYGQYPFIYVIEGENVMVVIDTGCGSGNLREFLDETINSSKNKPYLVFLSHVHFDHIGGAWSFCQDGGQNLLTNVKDIVMSNASIKFSKNINLCSLCTSRGANIKPFFVSNWCSDQQRFWLGSDHTNINNAVDLIHTPGHSSDSICLYSFGLNRLFVADSIYPYTAMDHSSIGHNIVQYLHSMERLKKYLCEAVPSIVLKSMNNKTEGCHEVDVNGNIIVGSSDSSSSGSSGNDPFELRKALSSNSLIHLFQSIISMPKNDIIQFQITKKQFITMVKEHRKNLEATSWTTEVAICFKNAFNCFPTSITSVKSVMKQVTKLEATSSQKKEPPISDGVTNDIVAGVITTQTATTTTLTLATCKTVLSCGHVEANLPAESISEVVTMLHMIKLGALSPTKVDDDDIGEWNSGQFHLIMPCNCIQKLNNIEGTNTKSDGSSGSGNGDKK
jgi:glyoxylase-like metal-dependent hydrolase (beta-lactamase superfamily II)